MWRSARTYILVGIVTLAALGLGRAFQPARNSAPAGRPLLLTSPQDYARFGDVWEDQRFTWTLPLTNPTAETVRVVEVRASCSCVGVEPRSFELAPGATRVLNLVFDLTPRPLETPGVPRPFAAELTVVTQTQTFAAAPEGYTIRGTVRPVLAVHPRDPSFGTRSDRVQPPLPASFAVAPAAALESLTAVCDNPGFAADVRPTTDGRFTVTVTPTAAVPAGAFAAEVRLLPVRAGGAALPERRVTVLGKVTADVTADPPEVAVGGRAVGEMVDELVSVGSLTGRAAAVETVTAHGDGVTAELTPTGAVRVRMAVARAGELRGRVELGVRAGHDAPVSVVVPVFGYGTAANTSQGGQR